jgi:phosphate transport system substrate-binding protein
MGAASAQQDSQGPLRAGGSSTVYPVASDAGSTWNANPPASDAEYWGPDQYGIDSDMPLADFWANLYGFEADGESGSLPYSVTVGLSHSGVGVTKLMQGQLDLGNSSAPISAELPDASESELDKFTDHVVAVDAQPIVVSNEIYEAGVQSLTIDEVRGIYRGEINNWSELGGPDREIQAVGRAEGSGTDTAFRLNVFGDPNASISPDVRKGQNQQVRTLVANSNNAIAYIALAFVDEPNAQNAQVIPLSLEIEGTTYTYGENLDDPEYPLNRDLHMYTYEGTSQKEAAYLLMITSDYGQKQFVEPNNYLTLSPERQQNQLENLPDAPNGDPSSFIGGQQGKTETETATETPSGN